MKTKTFFLSLLLLVPLAGCNKEMLKEANNESVPGETGTLTITLCGDDLQLTKALTAYTESREYESKINSVQLLLFNEGGDVIKDARFTSSFTSMQTTVPVGDYHVCAIINKNLESVYNRDELDDFTKFRSRLSDNSISGKSFVMFGNADCTVTSGSPKSCAISVHRIVGRVALHSIKAVIPDGYELYLKSVFLSNVIGEAFMDGYPMEPYYYEEYPEHPVWYNYDGRNKLSVDMNDDFRIIGNGNNIQEASDAQLPDLTSYSLGDYSLASGASWTRSDGVMSHVLLYGSPNAYSDEPNGRHEYYAGQATCLVVCAEVYSGWGNGGTNYYTIPLESFEANKTYTIDLTITGFGSDDPNKPVKKGSMTASVSVSGWSAGDVIEKTI